jgi:predicted dehydrogenase
MTKHRFRVGIAGVTHGHVADHLETWRHLPDATVVALAEPNCGLREDYVRCFDLVGARQYGAIEEMLEREELDVISVCNETSNHAAVVERATQKGVHCIVEKPLAFSLADAERMLVAAGTHRVHVVTNYPSRWSRAVLARALEFARRGGLGRVYEVRHRDGGPKPRAADADPFFQWLYQPATNGAGALVDFCSYGAEMAISLMGSPASVYALAGRWHRDDLIADDNGRVLLQYPRGVALAEGTWTQHARLPYSTLILGDEATLAVTHESVMVYTTGDEKHGRALSLDELPAAAPEASLQHHLLACLARGEAPVPHAGIRHHRDVVEVIDASLRSVKSGVPIRLPVPLPLMQAADWRV